MNKRALIAGFIVLAIGIVLVSVADHIGVSELTQNVSLQIRGVAFASFFVGGLLILSGVILLIYGAILPDPPVHWDNDL
jgi:hypothetical protein